jgi:hypothetical protein
MLAGIKKRIAFAYFRSQSCFDGSMSPARTMLLRILLVVTLAGFCVQWAAQVTPTEGNAARINARAEWRPTQAVLQQVRKSCPNMSFPALGECFARNMERAGSSAEAVAFTHLAGNEGYLHFYVPAGRVDIAFVTYPFRANTNEGCLLVNGSPPMIDVDKLSALPQAALQQDRSYMALAASNPNISLWPGDRSDRRSVIAGSTPEGGQRFAVEYFLLAGCHACARLGIARFAFDFDANGKLLGIKFVEIRRPAK